MSTIVPMKFNQRNTRVRTYLFLLAVVLLCTQLLGVYAQAEDTTAPTVTFAPVDGTVTNDKTTNITLQFNEAVRKEDGTPITITNPPTLSNAYTLVTLKKSGGGANLATQATTDFAANTITIDPTNDLSEGTYIITLLANTVEDTSDNAITLSKTATFTIDTTAPSLSYAVPSLLPVNTAISIRYPTITEKNKKSSGGYTLKAGYSLPTGLLLNIDTGAITGTPTAINSQTHTTTIVVTDAAGNTGEDTIIFPTVDAADFFKVTVTPADNATVADKTANITIALHSPGLLATSGSSITNANAHGSVTLKKKNGGAGGADGVDLAVLRTTTFNTNTNTITIDPSTDLTDGTYIIYFVVRTAASGGGAGVSIKQVGKFTIDTIAPSFSYTIPYYSLTVGTPITPMSPTPTTTEANPKRSGGYTLKAGYSLPPGLHLNTDTGAITGTPTTAKIRVHITIIVVTDAGG